MFRTILVSMIGIALPVLAGLWLKPGSEGREFGIARESERSRWFSPSAMPAGLKTGTRHSPIVRHGPDRSDLRSLHRGDADGSIDPDHDGLIGMTRAYSGLLNISGRRRRRSGGDAPSSSVHPD